MLGSCFSWRLVVMNKWVIVRKRERAIYTKEKVVYSDLCRSPHTDLGTSNAHWKHYARDSQSLREKPTSKLPTYVGTSDVLALLTRAEIAGAKARAEQVRGLASGLPTYVRTSNMCTRDPALEFRLTSGLPTTIVPAQHVGSFDSHRDFRHQKSQKVILRACEVLECL